MEGKTLLSFLSELEQHHGRQFNAKSIEILIKKFLALPGESITEDAKEKLKAGFNTIPAPLQVLTVLEAEAVKVRVRMAENFERQWEKEKAQESNFLHRLTREGRQEFEAQAFRFILAKAKAGKTAPIMREHLRLCQEYPAPFPLETFTEDLQAAEAAGLVRVCGCCSYIMEPQETVGFGLKCPACGDRP